MRRLIQSLRESLLIEMPIRTYKLVGQFGPNAERVRFDDVDRRIMTSPKAVEKIHAQWRYTSHTFDLYFVNYPLSRGHVIHSMGDARDALGITDQDDLPDAEPDAITVLFTNNNSVDRIPMTGWMTAHRTGHALSNQGSRVERLWYAFEDVVWQELSAAFETREGHPPDTDEMEVFASEVLTMKSARDNTIRDWSEVGAEVFAQYLLTSEVSFRTAIPGHSWKYSSRAIEHAIDVVLDNAVGEVFVQ